MFGNSGTNGSMFGNSGNAFGNLGSTGGGGMFGNSGNSTLGSQNKNIFGQNIGQPMFTKNDP